MACERPFPEVLGTQRMKITRRSQSRGAATPLTHRWRRRAARALCTLSFVVGGGALAAQAPPDPVRPGIEVLLQDSVHLVRGLRAGLITNPTGVDAGGRSSIDRLRASQAVELVRLFAPEHGLRASEAEGATVSDGVDPATGLPVISLYGSSKRAPTTADLDGLDVLLFDMQDIGARYYTYIYTMALAMEAAGDAGLPFIVLDRPNPIGGTLVQGNVLDPAFATFVGRYPIPMRHGMTPGELARLFRDAFDVDVTLHVVPATGWSRDRRFEDTGLPWIAPSPNMPSLESALHYPGLCLFEGTSLSVGRGTDHPFQQVGAPGLDSEALARQMNALALEGVRFEPVRFTPHEPTDGKFGGVEVEGVRAVATDPQRYDPTRAAVALLLVARAASGPDWSWVTSHFDRLAGTDGLRRVIDDWARDPVDLEAALAAATAGWAPQLEAFERQRAPALIYPDARR